MKQLSLSKLCERVLKSRFAVDDPRVHIRQHFQPSTQSASSADFLSGRFITPNE
jgi:hypothetical protein